MCMSTLVFALLCSHGVASLGQSQCEPEGNGVSLLQKSVAARRSDAAASSSLHRDNDVRHDSELLLPKRNKSSNALVVAWPTVRATSNRSANVSLPSAAALATHSRSTNASWISWTSRGTFRSLRIDISTIGGRFEGLDVVALGSESQPIGKSSPTQEWVPWCLLASYTLLCMFIEVRHGTPWKMDSATWRVPPGGCPQGATQSDVNSYPRARFREWDMARFFVQWSIVSSHMDLWFEDAKPYPGDAVHEYLRFFKVSAFAFISGVFGFGASVERSRIAKMLCFTLGTNLVFCAIMYMTKLAQAGGDFYVVAYKLQHSELWWPGSIPCSLWYLMSLCVWRLLVTPCFALMRNCLRMPSVLACFGVFVAAFFFRHTFASSWSDHPDFMGPLTWDVFGPFTWFYAPFFALGLVMSAKEWTDLLRNHDLQVLGLIVLIGWFAWLATTSKSEHASDWSTGACLADACPNNHFPDFVVFSSPSLFGFWRDVQLYVMKGIVTLAAIWVIAGGAGLLELISPLAARLIAGCGSQTIYIYVLHSWWWTLAFSLGGEAAVLHHVPQYLIGVWSWALSLFLALLFSCNTTCSVFAAVVKPYWIMDATGWLLGICRSRQDKLGHA